MCLAAIKMNKTALRCIFHEGKDLCLSHSLLLSPMLTKVIEIQTTLSNIWLMINKKKNESFLVGMSIWEQKESFLIVACFVSDTTLLEMCFDYIWLS